MRLWDCSRCDATMATAEDQAGTPTHRCAGLSGMTIPFAPAGQSSGVRLVERGDYVGNEDVQRDDDGRVWSHVVVSTDEADHVAVYAPTAHAGRPQ